MTSVVIPWTDGARQLQPFESDSQGRQDVPGCHGMVPSWLPQGALDGYGRYCHQLGQVGLP